MILCHFLLLFYVNRDNIQPLLMGVYAQLVVAYIYFYIVVIYIVTLNHNYLVGEIYGRQ